MEGHFYYEGGILKHHGVLGQSWGKRNGPPYPLYRNESKALRAARNYQTRLNADAARASFNSKVFKGDSGDHWKKISNSRLNAAKKSYKARYKQFGKNGKLQAPPKNINEGRRQFLVRSIGHNAARAAAYTALTTATGTTIPAALATGASLGTKVATGGMLASRYLSAVPDQYSLGKYATDTYYNRRKDNTQNVY